MAQRMSMTWKFVLLLSALLWMTDHAVASGKVVAYIPNRLKMDSFSETIDYDKITHINLAFENPTNDHGDMSFQKKNDILIARARAHKVKVLVSIGGGGAADNARMKARYFDLLSEPKRAGFVSLLAKYVVDHGFDGLDVDIEGPSINKDYGDFIHDLSAVLKPRASC